MKWVLMFLIYAVDNQAATHCSSNEGDSCLSDYDSEDLEAVSSTAIYVIRSFEWDSEVVH